MFKYDLFVLQESMAKINQEYYKEIAHRYEPGSDYIYSRKGIIGKVISNLIEKDGVRISGLEKIVDLKAKLGDKVQFIYTPTHKSQLDYLLFFYHIVVNVFENDLNLEIPRVIGGNNLIIPGVSEDLVPFFNSSPIDFKRCGMISLDREKWKDKEYQNTFKFYLERVLRMLEDLLFFPEGTRSREGEVKDELKGGILNTIFKIYHKLYGSSALDRDFAIIPVSNTYERVLEDLGFKDQERIKKKKENGEDKERGLFYHKLAFVLDIANGFSQFLFDEPTGTVHIDFGEPILLSKTNPTHDDYKAMVREMHRQLKGMARITPTSLVAKCFHDKGHIPKPQLTDEMQRALDALPKSVLLSDSMKDKSIEDIARRGLMFLTKGRRDPGIVEVKNTYFLTNKALIKYYSKKIAHHFNEKAA
jgi:glycerol-3-phosphate O-acyltransferase